MMEKKIYQLIAFSLVLLLATPLAWSDNGPAACQTDTTRLCASAMNEDGDLAVYQCLERHLSEVNATCREAVLRANPVLREQLEVEKACPQEATTLCQKEIARQALVACLENKYKQLGSVCLARLTAGNATLRAQVEKDADERKKKEEAEKAALEQQKKDEERRLKEAEQQKIAKEHYQQRYKDCKDRLAKESPEAPGADRFAYCDRYARLPVPSPEQNTCLTELSKALTAKYKKLASDKLQAELDAWEFCKTQSNDPAFVTCAKARLKDGDEIFIAGKSCGTLHQRCLAHLTGGKKSKDSVYRNFLFAICSSFETYYMTLNECAEKEASYWMGFYKQPRDGALVQQKLQENKKECVSFFEKINGFMDCIKETNDKDNRLRTTGNSKMLVYLCKQSSVYRKCVLKKFFRLPDYIQVLGYPSSQREQEDIDKACHAEELLTPPNITPIPTPTPLCQ